jgi:tryptophan-rich sensory protein
MPEKRLSLWLFIAIVLGIGLAVGFTTAPGAWYQGLAKPSFNPPDWLFGPVWSLLYVLIAIAGWRIWRIAPDSGAMRLWGLQLLLNYLWSPVFFGLQRPGLALLVIVALLAAIVGFVALARPLDRPAAWLFVPYALWVAFATLLNAAIWRLN